MEALTLHVFISAGEPSGDLHGANLAKSLIRKSPGIKLSGLGGDRMMAIGIDPLVHIRDLSVVGLLKVAERFFDLTCYLDKVRRYFRKHRPDVVVLIDFPGFNWWVADRARELGIPVVYFVPPQIWAWGSWRIAKMRRLVDRVLCNFPFEELWYKQNGVEAELVGHPYFDELTNRLVDSSWVEGVRRSGGPVIGLLPGSRNQELAHNLTSQLDSARRISKIFPQSRFHVACLNDPHASFVRDHMVAGRFSDLPITIHSGKTPEIIAASDITVAVSGSVSLELLQARVPSVILYQASRPMVILARWLMKCRYISLPNLIAEEELFPEFVDHKPLGEKLASKVCHWLEKPSEVDQLKLKLSKLWNNIARPGACDRAADHVIEMAILKNVKAA